MVTPNVLFPRLVSVPLKAPVPVTETVVTTGTDTFTVTTIVWPTARLAALQVMVPPEPCAGPLQAACGELTEMNGRVDGRVVAKTTSLATWLLPFLICQVKASVPPWVGPPFCAEPTTWISVVVVGPAIVVTTLAELSAGVADRKSTRLNSSHV